MTPPSLTNPAISNTLLFEHFATLTTAPEGIPRLRELILQLAVQGKLGTQDPEDEPASVLLKRITSERKNKKRKINAADTIQSEPHTYEIPKKWHWVRLNEIIDEVQPGFACGERDSRGIVQLRMNNINPRGDFIWDKILRVPFNEDLKQKYELRCGDILFNNTNSLELVGKSGLFKSFKEPIVFSNHFTRLRVAENRIDPAFVTLWLHNQWNSKIFEKICNKWIGQAAVNGNKLLAFQFPLPPLAEQHRIVAKVDRLMELCDELEARQQQERAGCLKLGTASLTALQNADSPEEFEREWAQVCDVFELILDCPENVGTLRQTILQLAVQGRLIRQEPGDEPISIARKKIKNNQILLPVRDDEKSFSVPANWEWYHMVDICDSIVDCPHTTPHWTSEGFYCVRTADVKPGKIDLNTSRFVSEETYKERIVRLEPQYGDIVYTREGTLGSAAVVPENIKLCLGQRLMLMRPEKYIDSFYLMLLLNSPLVLKIVEENTLGSTAKHVNVGDVKKYALPLPPLAEQHRIVAKVDALMKLCDALEARLKERAAVQERFAKAVGKQVAGG